MTRRERNEFFGHEAENPTPVTINRHEERLLELFWSVSKLREPAPMGIKPLSAEFKIYESLFHVTLTEPEIKWLLDVDRQYRISMGREQERESAEKTKEPQKGSYKEYG